MLIAQLGAVMCFFAGPNNDVEWGGISHFAWQDRRPLCPINKEAFSVLIQAYQFDLTAVRVNVDDGVTQTWLDGYYVYDRGPYAVWRADIPATTSNTLHYYFELTDGSDIDYYSVNGMSDDPPTDGGFVVDFATLSHAPIGATPVSSGGTVFKVWAPNATQAYVRGQFNSWGLTNQMTKVGEYFIAHVSNATDRQMYKYFFNPGAIWKSDARAKSLNPSDNYNSHIESPFRYTWSSGDFATPAFENMVLYEMHVGTFAGRNDPAASGAIPADYRDVAAHVGHLVELGVNAVELMPIMEFPTDFSAGYNPVTNWAAEWAHGTPDDLKYLVDTLHQNGIAVLLDIVWNHFSPSDNFMWQYDGTQIYFDTPFVDTPWGAQANFDSDRVREYYLDSASYWLDEFRVDGFRMDATDYMNIFPQEAAGWSLMQAFNNRIDNRWANKIAIAEQLPDDPWVTRPTSLGGAGFDAQWHDAFTDNLRSEILDAAFGDPEMWRISNIINGSGQYLSNTNVVNYFELHDECWPSSGGQRIVNTIDTTAPHDDIYAKGRVKLAQGLVMFAPGIPMILQGSEWLEDTNFGGGNSGGADRIDWSKKNTYANIFRYFKKIIAARKGNGGFRANSPHQISHLNESGNVIAFHRWDNAGNDLMVIANFSNTNYTDYQLGFPQFGRWYQLVNSQAGKYDGNGMGSVSYLDTTGGAYDGFDQSAYLTVPQMGLLVFRYNDPPPDDCPGDLDDDGEIGLTDLSIQLSHFGTSSGASPDDGDLDHDGDVDITDLSEMLSMYGAFCP